MAWLEDSRSVFDDDYVEEEESENVMRPRVHARLWQMYSWWDELVRMRIRHTNRIEAIREGKCALFEDIEIARMEALQIDENIKAVRKLMIGFCVELGPVWQWVTSIKGLGAGGVPARLMAQIDDISRFDTISKLWRFCGLAVIDGRAERKDSTHYSRKLKSTCWLVAKIFVTQRTPYYRDLYDDYKARKRREHPERVKVNGKWKYNDGHIDNMALRYIAKRFLSHLWLVWREAEGLETSDPWIIAHGGHEHLDRPPNYP